MKLWKIKGTDEKTVTRIIANRSLKQRLELISVYKTSIGRDLLYDFKDETSGHFRDTLECLLMTREQLDAYSFNKAIAGLGTDGKLEKNSFSQVSNLDFNFYQQQQQKKSRP